MDAAEIPAGEDAKTRRDYTRARYDYFMRDLERFDDAVGAKTTGVARNFVEKATRYKVVSQQQEYVDMLLRECKRALEAAPEHAIVQLRAAHLYNATGRAAKAVALLQSVAAQLQQPEFQSLYRARMECGQLMWWIETKIGTPANGDSWQQRYIDLLVEYGELDNELADQRFLHTEFNWTYGVLGLGPRETLATRVWDSKANPWLRHTLMGQFRVDNAWNQRGSGFAHTVTDEGWAAFRENMEDAAQHFTTAWEMDPQNPVASAEMIMVAENDYGDASTREWFDRSVAAQMDFPKAYWQYLYTLRPRWGGSWEEMVAFGEECLATERFDTAVPLVYIDAVCGVAQEQENWEQTLNDDDIFDRFVEILDQAAAAPERAEPLHGGYRGNQLTSAIYDLAADWNKKELRDEVQADLVDSYDSTYGQYIGLKYRTDRDIDAATAMPDHIRQKLSAWRPKTGDGRATTRNKLRRIAALFAEESESTTDPRQSRLLAEMAMQNDRQFRFGDGEWVPLDFDLSYHSWIEHGGSWKVIDSAQIEGRLPPASTGMRLWNAGSYPGPMELEVEITPLDSYGPSARPGLLIGYLGHIEPNPNGRVEEPGGRCFWLDPAAPGVGVGFTFDAKTKSHSIEPAESYRIRVKAWNGYYVVLVNDRYLFSQQSPTFKPDGYVGIGSM
ncbi:MAG: tetratricopeptide repeat protein, partial [Planctomycetota bacterium]